LTYCKTLELFHGLWQTVSVRLDVTTEQFEQWRTWFAFERYFVPIQVGHLLVYLRF